MGFYELSDRSRRITETNTGIPRAISLQLSHRSAPKRGMAFIEDILLSPKNLDLREDHLLAGSSLHREGFQDQ